MVQKIRVSPPPPLFFYLHVVEQLPSAGPHQNTIKFKPICFWKWPYIPLAYNVGEVSEWRKTKRKRLNLNHRDFLIGIVIDWWTIILISFFIPRFSPRTCEVSNISKPFRLCLQFHLYRSLESRFQWFFVSKNDLAIAMYRIQTCCNKPFLCFDCLEKCIGL